LSVVASTIYLSKYTEDFADFNEAYISMFTSDPKPSRTCIGVANLPAGTDVEITCKSRFLQPRRSRHYRSSYILKYSTQAPLFSALDLQRRPSLFVRRLSFPVNRNLTADLAVFLWSSIP